MATRIVINGKAYASVEAMPEEARRVYAEVLSHLKDSDGDGTPDIVRGPAGGQAVMVEHVETVRLNTPPAMDALDTTANILSRFLKIVLIAAAVAVTFGGALILMNLDAGSRSQGGAFYVVLGTVLVLGWLLGSYMSVSRRR